MTLRYLMTALIGATLLNSAWSHELASPYANTIPGVSANVLIKTDKSWNGSTLPAYPSGQPQITIVRYQFAPGAVLPVHKHPVINAGVMLKGELAVKTDNGEVLNLKAGDTIVELVDQWHEGRNNGTEMAELIIVYAGTPDLPLAIRQQTAPEITPASKPTPPAVITTPDKVVSGQIPYLSGGVGDESLANLVAREKEFDLKLFLVGQSGSYLSDIRITITDAKDQGVLLTTSEGPVLLANLPTGTYTIKAQKNGHTLEQKISVTPGKLQTTYFRFPGE